MRNRSCINKFVDEGTVAGSVIEANEDFIACGSTTGVVNVYKNEYNLPTTLTSGLQRKPVKTLMNLTTHVSSLTFNNQGEILAMASKEKENSVKLVHIPSMTVFSNFPFLNSNWGRPMTMTFSPNSGFFCLGNNRGSAYLYRVKHYENY